MAEQVLVGSKPMNLILIAGSTLLGLVFPQVFHYFGWGKEFLPMYLPLFFALLWLEKPWQFLPSSLILPGLSFFIFGMPLPAFAAAMTLELCGVVVLAGLFRRMGRLNPLSWTLLLLGGRLIEWGVLSLLGVSNASAFVLSGWPGFLTLLVLGVCCLFLQKPTVLRKEHE